jgi:hypothetical protein
LSKAKDNLGAEVNALFMLPLAEFTAARNSLATRLKLDGRANDANLVKTLAKPSISAWAANQLYWHHRDSFEQLLATGQRFRQAQTARGGAKLADIRGSLDARREALSHLSDLATRLLQDAGHNPTPETIHRITTTLEALSAYGSHADGPTPGRLTQDVDPPGFDSLASWIPSAGVPAANAKSTKAATSSKPIRAAIKTQPKAAARDDVGEKRRLEEAHRVRIAAAKLSLQDAKRLLADARPRIQRLDSAKKKASAEAKAAEAKMRNAEKHLREAEKIFKQASFAAEDAARRSQQINAEAVSGVQAVEDARRTVEQASKELESLFRES